jgi:hypothetical protein
MLISKSHLGAKAKPRPRGTPFVHPATEMPFGIFSREGRRHGIAVTAKIVPSCGFRDAQVLNQTLASYFCAGKSLEVCSRLLQNDSE